MTGIVGTGNITSIRKRVPAILGPVSDFIIWCHATAFEDVEVAKDFANLNKSFAKIRGVDPLQHASPSNLKPEASIGQKLKRGFASGKQRFRDLISRKSDAQPKKQNERSIVVCVNLECGKKLALPAGYEGTIRCPKCGGEQNTTAPILSQKVEDSTSTEMNSNIKKKASGSLPKSTFDELILEMLSPDTPVQIGKISTNLVKVMNSKGYDVKNVTQVLALFEIPRGVKKAIISRVGEQVEFSGTTTDPMVRLAPHVSEKMAEKSEPSAVPLPSSKFQDLILTVIGDREVHGSVLGSKIIEYQEDNHWPETGKKALNAAFGFPESRSYKESISLLLSDEIEITGQDAAVTYKRRDRSPSDSSNKKETEADSSPMIEESVLPALSFEDLILKVIGSRELHGSVLGAKIIEYQEDNHWPETGKKALNAAFGFPESRSYKESISLLLPERIEITGAGSSATFKKRNNPLSEFPKIKGFNMAKGGLRYPQSPKYLADMLTLNASFETSCSKSERIDKIHEALGGPRSRINVIFVRLIQMDLLESAPVHDTLKGLRNHFETSTNDFLEWTSEDIQYIERYFDTVEALLPPV